VDARHVYAGSLPKRGALNDEQVASDLDTVGVDFDRQACRSPDAMFLVQRIGRRIDLFDPQIRRVMTDQRSRTDQSGSKLPRGQRTQLLMDSLPHFRGERDEFDEFLVLAVRV
jgi:hypothetical protein